MSVDLSVHRAAHSAPSGRDFRAEKDALLAKAQELRNEADAIDLEAATRECLQRGSAHFSTAHEIAEHNAARALEKARAARDRQQASWCASELTAPVRVCARQISEQQERFKTSLVVDGFDIEAEMVESSAEQIAASPARASVKSKTNKYAAMISRRKELQAQEQQQG